MKMRKYYYMMSTRMNKEIPSLDRSSALSTLSLVDSVATSGSKNLLQNQHVHVLTTGAHRYSS